MNHILKFHNLHLRNKDICMNRKCISNVSKHLFEFSCPAAKDIAIKDLLITENFITKDEEEFLVKEIDPRWRRLKYQSGHWDNAIQDFREIENENWSTKAFKVLSRARKNAFSNEDVQRPKVHVLDLSAEGYIKPHVDSVRFCGRVIGGLSLLSPSIMKFVKEDDNQIWFKALLGQRSFYIMQNRVRYEFNHQILKNEESTINGTKINKGRRISMLFRSDPVITDNDENKPNNLFQSTVIQLDQN